MKSKNLVIRITPEQEESLLVGAENANFSKKSEYARWLLFSKTKGD